MNFLTVAYLVAHLAAALLCTVTMVVVPFVAMLIFAIVSGDPGGPLFFPIFLLLLIPAGLGTSAMLSLAVGLADCARLRWRSPLWLPPLLIFCAVALWLALSVNVLIGLSVGLTAAFVFVLYWFTVSTAWFLPRLFARLFQLSPAVSHEQVRNI